jgi:uncharacterized peroxidase-related enzyme
MNGSRVGPDSGGMNRPAMILRSDLQPFRSAQHQVTGGTNAMSAKPISRYPVPQLDQLPEDIRSRILAVQEKAGFVPNVFLAFAHRPDEFRAFFAYHDALMEKEGGLSKAEREMIVVATSSANQCQYCVVAHGAILRIRGRNPLIADQVATNYRKADITPRQRAMLAFAMKISQHAGDIEDADFDGLRAHGFSDEDIWDIGAVSAFFALSNRMANLVSMRPNDEFYLMGRTEEARAKDAKARPDTGGDAPGAARPRARR